MGRADGPHEISRTFEYFFIKIGMNQEQIKKKIQLEKAHSCFRKSTNGEPQAPCSYHSDPPTCRQIDP